MEAGAGGKLLNVVVANDDISKVLLQRKCYDNFVVYCPVNKLESKRLSEHIIEEARKIASSFNAKVWVPYSKEVASVYDPNHQIVLDYAMQGFLICDNLDAAEKISNNGRMAIKVVTLEGDSFDPRGQITGGFSGQRDSLFLSWIRYQRRKVEIDSIASEKMEASEQLRKLQRQKDELNQRKSSNDQMVMKIERMKSELKELKSNSLKVNVEQEENRLLDLKQRLVDSKAEEEKLKQDLESNRDIVKRIKEGGNLNKIVKEKVKELELQEKSKSEEYKEVMSKHAEFESNIQKELDSLHALEEKNKEDKEALKTLNITLKEYIATSEHFRNQVSELNETKEALSNELQAKKNQLRKMSNQIVTK